MQEKLTKHYMYIEKYWDQNNRTANTKCINNIQVVSEMHVTLQ